MHFQSPLMLRSQACMQVSREVQDTLTRLKSQGADPSDLLYKALAQLVFDGSALQAGQSRLFLLDLVQGLQEPVKGQVFSSLTQAVSTLHRLVPQVWTCGWTLGGPVTCCAMVGAVVRKTNASLRNV